MPALFILGGARSGKSRFALSRLTARQRVTFVATALRTDPDMAARIDRHRRERPAAWTTLEEPFDVVGCLAALDGRPEGSSFGRPEGPSSGRPEGPSSGRPEAVIVDCLTLWIANRQLRGDPDEAILDGGRRLAAVVSRAPWDLALISNEVGEGVHPETAAGLRFRDLLGQVNQDVAAAADSVLLMVAGIPLTIKAGSARIHEKPHEQAPQAP
jgi:adenosylcobinamide kinase / adenosylcobinamide-phosphate guanylyltransferase